MIDDTHSPLENLRIRDARAGDGATIAAFNRAMAWETEGVELDANTTRAGVAVVLAEPSHGFYLLAERGGEVLGALLVTYEWSDWRNARFWWIQSVYVSPAARGQGVYRALHTAVRHRARNAGGVCGLRLYVDADNHAAMSVYASLGMHASRYRLFEEDH